MTTCPFSSAWLLSSCPQFSHRVAEQVLPLEGSSSARRNSSSCNGKVAEHRLEGIMSAATVEQPRIDLASCNPCTGAPLQRAERIPQQLEVSTCNLPIQTTCQASLQHPHAALHRWDTCDAVVRVTMQCRGRAKRVQLQNSKRGRRKQSSGEA